MVKHTFLTLSIFIGLSLWMLGCGKGSSGTTDPSPNPSTPVAPATSSTTSSTTPGTAAQTAPGTTVAGTPGPTVSNAASTEIVKQARQDLDTLTKFHEQHWQMSKANAWHDDREKATIAWTFDNGKIVIAPMQIIGVYDKQSKTFTWSWDDPGIPGPLRQDAEAVRVYAVQNGITGLQQKTLACSEDDAWSYTALASNMGGRQGAFRGDEGDTITFMTFGEVQISKLQSP